MTRHPIAILLLILLLLAAPCIAAGEVIPPRAFPPASTCDSVSPTPITGEMILTSVSVNGGGNTASVAANDSFTVSIDFHIQVCEEPVSANYCQVVVGYASSAQPLFCVFRDRVDCTGLNGNLTFRMKAPAFPSEYLIAFDLQRTLVESVCPVDWPQGPPTGDRRFACITVTAGNLPVPVTGGADNVTSTSATLHGTVNPAGVPTTARFLVGTAPGVYTDSVDAVEGPVSGSEPLAVSGALTGLSGNSRYYYRTTAESENGYNLGEEQSFYTGALFLTGEAVHSFGHLALNGFRTDSVAIFNGGNLPMQVTSVIPMSGQYSVSPGSAVIGPAGSRKFAVTFAPPAYGAYNSGIVFNHTAASTPDTLPVQGDVPIGGVLAGWNIVSVPLTVADPRKTVVFPGAVSGAYEYSLGYIARDTVLNGLGYWLKYPAVDSLVVSGSLRENETMPVAAGWNMVGGPSYEVPLDSIISTPPGIVAGNFFEYAAGYAPVSALRPGKGYWVKVTQAGAISLKGMTGGGAAPVISRGIEPYAGSPLVVTDARGLAVTLFAGASAGPGEGASLPPPPPQGAFDARFDGDRISARLAPGDVVALLVSGARHPVTVSWPEGVPGFTLFVDGSPLSLDAPGSAEIGPGRTLELGSSGGGTAAGLRPRSTGLAGNYPNPFNPSTVIRYEMESAGVARLVVYNALGETVSVLADGPASAGTHTALFDAAGYPGGVYYCRLFTALGASTIRMLLVK